MASIKAVHLLSGLLLVLCSVHLGQTILCYNCGGSVGGDGNCDIPSIITPIIDCRFGDREQCMSYTFVRNTTTTHIPIVVRGCAFDYDCINSLPYPNRVLSYCNICAGEMCNNEIFIGRNALPEKADNVA